MAVVVPPKIIRALTRFPPGAYPQTPSDPNLACWNFALTGEDPHAPPIGDAYDYVNGRTAVRPDLTFPNAVGNSLNDLDAVRQTYTQHTQHHGPQYDAGKRQVLEQCSTRMLPVLCGLYGLPVSLAPTAIEIGLKFEARLVKGWLPSKGRLELDWELAEREDVLEVGYEHMWVRINQVRTVETWVSKTTIHAAPTEQPPSAHKTVTRCYVSQLLPEHVTKLTRLVTARKGATAFQHPVARQAWTSDWLWNSCTWCNETLVAQGTRHHCRACGRIFCQACTPQTEAVVQPALQPRQPVPLGGALLRVCDTCYTGPN
jgi:hypothetical protein